jgi:hypothetical protein
MLRPLARAKKIREDFRWRLAGRQGSIYVYSNRKGFDGDCHRRQLDGRAAIRTTELHWCVEASDTMVADGGESKNWPPEKLWNNSFNYSATSASGRSR